MEGMEHLSLTDGGLDDDPMLSYTPAQLCRHEAAQALLANPPLEGAEERIWSHLRQSKVFHVNAIHHLELKARTQTDSNLPLARVEHPTPPIILDTDQPGSMLTPEGQPLTRTVTIDDALPSHMLISKQQRR
jgi:hypothetical protein